MPEEPTESLQVARYSGADIEPLIPELARLRIQVFREYPYLYEGSLSYEEQYLQTYSAAAESLFVVVRDGGRVVGVSTGVPMEEADEAFQQPFREAGYDLETIFYFGESVLHPDYRGRGMGRRFFEERERYARALGRFTRTTFCAVERPADHPRRPAAYRPLDPFWEGMGYEKHPELRAWYAWQDLDEAEESPKPMVFWVKRLEAVA